MSQNISPNDAYELLQDGNAILIDVREPNEFMQEHIAYAISIPLSSFEESLTQLNIPENKTIIFQCLKGKRGEMACERASGIDKFKNPILNISGGIGSWKEEGLVVVTNKSNEPEFSPRRQVQIIVGGTVLVTSLMGGWASHIAALFGGALLVSGILGICPLAMIISKMPWNK